jgi:hypothetical protein
MRSRNAFFAGAVAGAGVLVLASSLLQREPTVVEVAPNIRPADRHGEAALPKGEMRAPSVQPAGQHEATLVSSGTSADPPGGPEALEPPGTEAEWNTVVGGMLEWQVDRRTGQEISAEQRDRLLAQLARLRDASLSLQEGPSEPDEPAELRERLTRTLALVQVDEAFRRELGIGVADFLRQLDPSAVEDVSPGSGQQ